MKMLMVIGFILGSIWASQTFASQLDPLLAKGFKFPITKTIIHLQPSLSWKEANKRASIIFKLSEEYGLPWKIIVSVAFVESSFLFMTHRRLCGLTKTDRYACVFEDAGELGVNLVVWQHRLGLSVRRMLTDVEYGYTIGVRILKSREDVKDPCWVGTYHSYTKSLKKKYCNRVNKIEKQIERFLYVTLSGLR